MGMVSADSEDKHMAAWHAWSTLASLALDLSWFFFVLSTMLSWFFSSLGSSLKDSRMKIDVSKSIQKGMYYEKLVTVQPFLKAECQLSREENSPHV